MKKDILLRTYYGDILFKGYPRNFKRKDFYALAEKRLEKRFGKLLIDISNSQYITKPYQEIYDFALGFAIIVDFEN